MYPFVNYVRTYLSIVFVAIALAGCANNPQSLQAIEPIPEINIENSANRLALHGYDPVAYFKEQAAVAGSPEITTQWRGAVWQFANKQNRAAFVAKPEFYAPQYGGYCAIALSWGIIADIDPDSWYIEDNKLYLNNNAVVHKIWLQDIDGNILDATENWRYIHRYPIHSKPKHNHL